MAAHTHIVRLEIENFKSYRGICVIEDVPRFVAIVGPNGAGKSNLGDALCFGLGIDARMLRGQGLKDLIYRYDPGSEPKPLVAGVRLTLSEGDEGGRLTLGRHITPGGSSQYSLQGKTVSWEEYEVALELRQLKNFLVQQGGVDELLAPSSAAPGMHITALIERISGSGALAPEYDAALSEEREAREAALHHYQKRRALAAERKQFKEQKAEADKWRALQEEARALHVQATLARLWDAQQALDRIGGERLSKVEQTAALEGKETALVKAQEGARKAQAQAQKEALALTKRLREKERTQDQRHPEAVRAREELRQVERQGGEAKEEVQRLETQRKEQAAKLTRLRQDLADLQRREQEQAKEEAKQDRQSAQVQLTPDDEAEYARLKAEAGKATAELRQTAASLSRQVAQDESALSLASAALAAAEERVAEQQQRRVELERRVERAEAGLGVVEARRDEMERDRQQLATLNSQAKQQQGELSAEVAQLQAQLSEAKSEREQDERERRQVQAVGELRRAFPGRVHGRVADLCRPKNQRYALAVSVALGKHLDAVVVADEGAALECLRYLKEHRLGTATLLPLTSLQVKPLPEDLRTLGKRVYPLLDVLQYERDYARALEYVCGPTLVVESLPEARALAFGGTRRKVVTLQGALILKSGLMTGGTGPGTKAQDRARRWEQPQLELLRTRRDAATAQLQLLGAQLRAGAREETLKQTLAGLHAAVTAQRVERDLLAQALREAQQAHKEAEAATKKCKAELGRVQTALAQHKGEHEAQQRKIQLQEEQHFGPLSRRLGVPSLRQWEQERELRRSAQQARLVQHAEQRSRTEQLLAYEEQRDLPALLEAARARLRLAEGRQTELRATVQAAEGQQREERAQLEALRGQLRAAEATALEKEGALKEARRHLAALRRLLLSAQQGVVALEAEALQTRERRHALLRLVLRDELPLPLARDSAPLPHLEAALDPASTEQVQPDWSALTGAGAGDQGRRVKRGELSGDRWAQELEARAAELQVEAERVAPNLKAQEHLAELDSRLDALQGELDLAQGAAKTAAQRLDRAKAQRLALYSSCYEHVAGAIDGVYKALTGGQGAAYLTQAALEDPYLHGTLYSPQPPNKPFSDLGQLSGGEKAVAALALLFALATWRPAPFFLLDEVDAALDAPNVQRLATFIRTKAHVEGVQFVVISLKERLYELADTLLGVHVEPAKDCSALLTLDLTRFQ